MLRPRELPIQGCWPVSVNRGQKDICPALRRCSGPAAQHHHLYLPINGPKQPQESNPNLCGSLHVLLPCSALCRRAAVLEQRLYFVQS